MIYINFRDTLFRDIHSNIDSWGAGRDTGLEHRGVAS